MSRKALYDADNPEWTTEDFERAKPAAFLPPDIRKMFPQRQASSDVTKEGSGPGWRSRLDDVLKEALGQ